LQYLQNLLFCYYTKVWNLQKEKERNVSIVSLKNKKEFWRLPSKSHPGAIQDDKRKMKNEMVVNKRFVKIKMKIGMLTNIPIKK
jgi:hypothetical protein